MKALLIHALYIYKDPNYVSGHALCTGEYTGIRNYPGEGPDGRMIYGWQVRNIDISTHFW